MNGTITYNNLVMKLIIINIIIFFLQGFTALYMVQYPLIQGNEVVMNNASVMTYYFGLTPALVVQKFFIWQIVSYMFLHGGFFHLFFKMYARVVFGIPIEQTWGSRKFLLYYFFTGAGAGLMIFVINFVIGGPAPFVPTIGASGAVFGMLLAFGILYPNAEILLFFFLPIKAKYLVVMYGAIEFYSLISSGGQGNISHVGHLGGLLFGLLYFAITRKKGISFKAKINKARFARESASRKVESAKPPDDRAFLAEVLRKVRKSGHDALSDDEMQHLKYLEIMVDEPDNLCVDEDYDDNDAVCKKCDNMEACLIREIKRHL
jgi:membrane associated rhomboid family serine protease